MGIWEDNLIQDRSHFILLKRIVLYYVHHCYRVNGAGLRILKSSACIFKLVVCNPCKSSPSSTIFVPVWFIIISFVFLYLKKLLFAGLLQLKGNCVCGQITKINELALSYMTYYPHFTAGVNSRFQPCDCLDRMRPKVLEKINKFLTFNALSNSKRMEVKQKGKKS